jgi:GAF domain-containing protein
MDTPDDTSRYAALMSHRLTRHIVGDAKSVELVEAAARRFAVPVASIGLVGRSKVHLVAEVGTRFHVVPREHSFSALAILGDAPLVVEDTQADPRLAAHPGVMARHVRFVAAAPLIDREGQRLGAFCIIDRQPRTLAARDLALLVRYAAAAMARIDFLSVIAELSRRAVLPEWAGATVADELIW